MCIFSQKVSGVNSTKIFARKVSVDRTANQLLAYQMHYEALTSGYDLAMILPIPVPHGTEEDSVIFFDFSETTDFFKRLDDLFPKQKSMSRGLTKSVTLRSELKLARVGSFNVSFSPTISDMDRLNKCFTLPMTTWDKIPQYEDYGFVVVQLARDATDIHPVAFSFPTRFDDALYFPTLHIHDNEVHRTEKFNHSLFAQFCLNDKPAFAALKSPQAVERVMLGPVLLSDHGFVKSHHDLYRQKIEGVRRNADILLQYERHSD